MNIAIITLDSLRFDSSQLANTPAFGKLFDIGGKPTGWEKVGAHGTYTLPAHISIFQGGILPCTGPADDGPYNKKVPRTFGASDISQSVKHVNPLAPNIVKGFEANGYRTIGIGGVSWFDISLSLAAIWKDYYFQEFYWKKDFSEFVSEGIVNQIILLRELMKKEIGKPLFFFLNIAATHTPYMGNEKSPAGQAKCLEYVDTHIMKVIHLLPRPLHLIIMGDHGDCMGEDGMWGHTFYHPKVMEVPMVSLMLD